MKLKKRVLNVEYKPHQKFCRFPKWSTYSKHKTLWGSTKWLKKHRGLAEYMRRQNVKEYNINSLEF